MNQERKLFGKLNKQEPLVRPYQKSRSMKIVTDREEQRSSVASSSICSQNNIIDSFQAKFLSNLQFQEQWTAEQQQFYMQYMYFMQQ